MSRFNPHRGAILTVLLWACFAGAVLLVSVRWVDSTVGIVVALQSMVPLAAVLVAVLPVFAASERRWPLTGASGVLLAVCAAMVVPSMISHTVPPGPDDLVVMSANLEHGGADAQSLVRAVREQRVEVLVLLEITPYAVERLRLAGLDTFCRSLPGDPVRTPGGPKFAAELP